MKNTPKNPSALSRQQRGRFATYAGYGPRKMYEPNGACAHGSRRTVHSPRHDHLPIVAELKRGARTMSHVASALNIEASGLEDVVATTTRLSDVDGKNGRLTLAGKPVEEAAARPSSVTSDSASARELMVAAIDLLERAVPEEDVGVQDISESVGLSRFHFVRLFKRETGVTPYQYLLQLRIRHAIGLLRDTQRPVTEIAFDVGFGDLSNFINTFRRKVGCSPRRFRTAAANESLDRERSRKTG
jgi:AraC-like DNA-binding protein